MLENKLFSLFLRFYFLFCIFLYKQRFLTKCNSNIAFHCFNLHKNCRPNHLLFLFWSTKKMKVEQQSTKGYVFGNWSYSVNRSLIAQADVIIFHHNEIKPTEYPKKASNQIWIWFNMEAYQKSYDYSILNGKFNYTATYLRDSDIHTPYAFMIRTFDNSTFVTPYFINFFNKTKLICWIVSNDRNLPRMQYYHQLKRFIQIDVYGKYSGKRFNGSVCNFISKYKFYLAFENTITQDYITEKLYYNSFQCGSIPVCFGTSRANYIENGVPNNSFIHVDDFRNPFDLAQYLYRVANNVTLYNSYLSWRREYSIQYFSWSKSYYYIMDQYYRFYDRFKPKTISDFRNSFH